MISYGPLISKAFCASLDIIIFFPLVTLTKLAAFDIRCFLAVVSFLYLLIDYLIIIMYIKYILI